MKFKTLKDFDILQDCIHHPDSRVNCAKIVCDELRQEAIKRAKYLNKQIPIVKKQPLGAIRAVRIQGRIDEIIEFNNLTEKDLNGK